nr:MAG TPA: hypothetical protein [Caudoviricetes sp.]
MYEKIVNHFEENLCMENIYFRKHYKKWIIGIIVTLVLEFVINYILSMLIENLWVRSGIAIIADFTITIIMLIFIYVLPLIKIYRKQVNIKTKFDLIGTLMKEECLSAYREVEIEEMEHFLKNECKIKKIESINMIVELLDQEIEDKYKKKNFIEKYFNNTILPIIIFILTIYFTNNNEQQLTEIIAKTITSVLSIMIVMYFIAKIKNINITPVDKKHNLLELKRLLIDIMIKWNK